MNDFLIWFSYADPDIDPKSFQIQRLYLFRNMQRYFPLPVFIEIDNNGYNAFIHHLNRITNTLTRVFRNNKIHTQIVIARNVLIIYTDCKYCKQRAMKIHFRFIGEFADVFCTIGRSLQKHHQKMTS